LREQAPDLLQQCRHLGAAARTEITSDAAGHHGVHHEPMAEARLRGAQGFFAQDAALGVHERERRIIADGPDIPKMIGETFELCHQRPQIDRTGRNLDVQRRLDCMSKGKRVSNRAVARGAAG
jgi:hypothetical protein